MDVFKKMQLLLVWILVSGVSSWFFVWVVKSVGGFGLAFVGLFKKVYEVSPVLLVVGVFVLWGVVVVWLIWKY